MGELTGVTLTPQKRIHHDKGDILHAIKVDDAEFTGFGEAYFSTIVAGAIKGWKQHQRMTLNIVVPVGSIKFVIYSESEEQFYSVTLGEENYQRLTLQPGLWMAFQGEGKGSNMLLNIASIAHDPTESHNKPLDEIPYAW